MPKKHVCKEDSKDVIVCYDCVDNNSDKNLINDALFGQYFVFERIV